MLRKLKMALRISTDAYDTELLDLMYAAKLDLKIAGVSSEVLSNSGTDPLVERAIITYCKYHFGEPVNPDKLKASYDEQKMQLQIAQKYRE